MPERGFLQAQLLDLMLRKVPDTQSLRGQTFSRKRRQLAGDCPQQGRLACAVRAEQADALAGEQRPVDIVENAPVAVTERHVFEAYELARVDFRGRELERERAVDMRRG